MAFVANPFGSPGLITGLAAFAMAALVYFTRPRRAQNRYLALVLALEGVVAFAGTGLMFLTDSYASAYAWQAVTVLAILALPPLHLLFVGTFETPLVRPLRAGWVRVGLVALAVLLPLLWLWFRDAIVVALVPVPFAPWEILPGPGWTTIVSVLAVTYVIGTGAAFDAWRRTAPGSPARARANAFLLAFTIHDMIFFLAAFGPFVAPALVGGYFYAFGPAIMQALFLPLLAYGILRAQLFDIDLRLKWTIRRGTLLAAFLLAFVVVAEIAQNWVSNVYGYAAGGVAAGLLILFIAPLQRVADRVADVAMPGVAPNATYLSYKRMEVYKAALEGALEEGGVDAQERAVLRRLREKLGLSEADALALEHELTGRAPP